MSPTLKIFIARLFKKYGEFDMSLFSNFFKLHTHTFWHTKSRGLSFLVLHLRPPFNNVKSYIIFPLGSK